MRATILEKNINFSFMADATERIKIVPLFYSPKYVLISP